MTADSTSGARGEALFFELFEALPRQGPGSRACTARALALCEGLPAAPSVLDLGCGAGAQTLDLAELTGGTIVAIDNHAPFIAELERRAGARGLSERVRAVVGDMASPTFSPDSFDLIWSEGALYFLGIDRALRLYRPLVRPGGHLVFTDAVWRKSSPPAEVRAIFDAGYPDMGTAADVLATIERCGLEVLGHFALPDETWWDDFYTPMLARLEAMRGAYANDAEALAAVEELAREPEMYREHAAFYGYDFFVTRRAA